MTDKKTEALRLALDALEHEAEIGNDDAYRRERDAIREALAEPPEVLVAPKLRSLAKLAKELDGVIADVEQGCGFDDVCLDTVKYVRDALAQSRSYEEQPAPQHEQHQDWCASLTQMLMSMPPKPAPCNCKQSVPQERMVVKTDCFHGIWLAPKQKLDVCAAEQPAPEVREQQELAEASVEPVAWMSPGKERLEFSRADTVYGSHTIPLYTHPSAGKPLTDEEIDEIYYKSDLEIERQYDQLYGFARAIEAAHGIKEKNVT